MSKIAVLLPRMELVEIGKKISQQYDMDINDIRFIKTEEAVKEARYALERGASVIVARGRQARLIERYTKALVSRVVVTAQEMGLLITKAKEQLEKKHPFIAVIGQKNAFCDMRYFEQIFDIKLKTYYDDDGDAFPAAVLKAKEDGADLVIGGDTVIKTAEEENIPCLFLSSTEDSLYTAMEVAIKMEQAQRIDKIKTAELSAFQDYSYYGIARITPQLSITAANRMFCEIVGKQEEALKGSTISSYFKELTEKNLKGVFEHGDDYSVFTAVQGARFQCLIIPIQVDKTVFSAAVAIHRVFQNVSPNPDEHRVGEILSFSLDSVMAISGNMKKTIRQASRFASSSLSVVLMGEPGTEKRQIAQGIHLLSIFKDGPYIEIDCAQVEAEDQMQEIFSKNGRASQARGGTLCLMNTEFLTKACFQKALSIAREGMTREIWCMSQSPAHLYEDGGLTDEVRDYMSSFLIEIPPLRERKKDLERLISINFQRCCEKYGRYHELTKDAFITMAEYHWPGNLLQLSSFCDRLVVLAEHRSINAAYVKNLLTQLYPPARVNHEKSEETGSGAPRALARGEQPFGTLSNRGLSIKEEASAERIRKSLREHDGSRARTAQALNISKTTLWRRMQKLGIE